MRCVTLTALPWNLSLSAKFQSDLEVVELEGFGVVTVEAVSHKDGSAHQRDQQHHADAHPSFVRHMHLQSQSENSGGQIRSVHSDYGGRSDSPVGEGLGPLGVPE